VPAQSPVQDHSESHHLSVSKQQKNKKASCF